MSWKITCKDHNIEFTLPSREDVPNGIPGIDYRTTKFNAASWGWSQMFHDTGDKNLEWTVTSPKGEVTHWDAETLHRLHAIEILAG